MMNTRLLWRALILCAAGPLVACSGDKSVNIGNTTTIGSKLSDYAATWDGYAEAHTFMGDGSDHVRLTIAADGSGTLQVGNQPQVAPATDPNVGYPPAGVISGINNSTGDIPPIYEGFSYPIYSAQVQTDRVQVGIKPHDYYTSWCALQTPFAYVTQDIFDPDAGIIYHTVVPGDAGIDGGSTSAVMYSECAFEGSFSTTDANGRICYGELNGVATQIDCGKFDVCNLQVCACTADGCGSSPLIASGSAPSQYPVELDAALDNSGQTLTGILALSSDLRITVVLQKQ